ncbi:MAG: Dyp-type peroxidase [Myxococcota bacterium]
MAHGYDPDVQGIVYSGYRTSHEATYLLLEVRSAAGAREWLRELAAKVRFGREQIHHSNVNVALSALALHKLGVSQAAIESFSPAFQEGIHSARRSLILDDVGQSSPQNWLWGGERAPAQIALLVFSPDAATHTRERSAEQARAERFGLSVAHELAATSLPQRDEDLREPFGFADGLSQPVIAGTPDGEKLSSAGRTLHVVAPGEILLGHRNVYGELTSVPWLSNPQRAPRFGVNGSYFVLRQLRQDVAGFWKYFGDQAKGDPAQKQRLAAKAIGRWRNGAPLALYPEGAPPRFSRDAENDFSYRAADPLGDGCPLGSHVRRGNPRDSKAGDPDQVLKQTNAHRILRRGRTYGPRAADPASASADGHERGLLFACLNANIERQFEFVHHSWLGNPSFLGLHEEGDPLIAADADPAGRFTIPGMPLRERLTGVPRFVSVVGGGYFFLPGRRGLFELAGSDAP